MPPGFVVPGRVHRTVAAEHGLDRRAGEALARVATRREALEAEAAALEAAWRAVALPPALVAAVARGLAALPPGPVAVRSSAALEDRAAGAGAGLFETRLGVRGLDGVLDALRACWASSVAAPALAYRLDHPAADVAADMAVIVQAEVEPRAAGVLFTRQPPALGASGPGATAPDDALETVIEAVAGPGRLLADGLLDPARYRLPAARAATAPAAARPAGGPLPPDGPLGARDLAALDALARAVERALAPAGERGLAPDGVGPSGPLDIEWAIDAAGRAHLLQARPVTRALGRPAERVVWTAANTQEALLEPVTPLTWSLFAPLVEGGRRDLFLAAGLPELPGPGYMKLFFGLPYFNRDYFRRFLREIPGAPETIFDALIFGEGAPRIDVRWSALRPRTLRLLGLLVAARALARERFELFQRAARLRLAWLARGRLEDLADEALLARRAAATDLLDAALRRHVLGTAIAGAAYLLLDLALERGGAGDLGRGRLVQHLVAGAPGSALARASDRLERLAVEAAGRPALAAALAATAADPGGRAPLDRLRAAGPDGAWFARALAAFLRDWGHRCEKEAELMEPRWADDPAVLLAVVARMVEALRAGRSPPRPEERERRLARRAALLAARAARRMARASRLERWLPLRRAALRALVREARRYAPYRENLKDTALRAAHLVRRCYLEAGRRLALRGALARPDDVFFLETAEVEAALRGPAPQGLGERAAARRREREGWLARRPPRWVVEVPGAPPRPVHADDRPVGLLAGVGVSGGRVTARARVLEGMHDAARLGPGEVIVARVVNAGWTPLFHLAAGVVAEVGGVLSHAAIVAREYGLPAVFGAAGACAIPDGALVTVDGELGVVTVEPPGAPS